MQKLVDPKYLIKHSKSFKPSFENNTQFVEGFIQATRPKKPCFMYNRKGKLYKCRKLHTLTYPLPPLTERVLIAAANRTTFTETNSKNNVEP